MAGRVTAFTKWFLKLSPARLIGQISLLDAPCKPVDPFPKTPYGSFRSGRTLSIQNRNDAHVLFVQPAFVVL